MANIEKTILSNTDVNTLTKPVINYKKKCLQIPEVFVYSYDRNINIEK